MKSKILLIVLSILPAMMHSQVTIQRGAGIFLSDNAVLTLQGYLDSEDNVEGNGTIILGGPAIQFIGAHNNALPVLSVENNLGVSLTSALKISKSLILRSGHLYLGRYNLELGSDATAGGNSSAYIVSADNGKVIKSIQNNLHAFMVPIGTTDAYAPLLLKSSGKYNNGQVEIGAKANASPNKPLSSKDYLENYWTIYRSGIEGDLTVSAFYNKVAGNEGNIRPYYWNGSTWINKVATIDTKNKSLNITIPEGAGQIYGMRRGDELLPGESSMIVMPNPVRNTATLIIRSAEDDNVTLRITDARGTSVLMRKVTLRKGVNQVNISVMSFANGHYTISSTQKNSKAIQMVKQ
jgi:hypothetical protein